MKTLKVALAVFMVCFFFGIGLISVSPAPVEAGPGGIGCHTECPIVECRDMCNDIDYEHWRCKIDGRIALPAFVDCELLPHDCGCSFIGCGGACVGS